VFFGLAFLGLAFSSSLEGASPNAERPEVEGTRDLEFRHQAEFLGLETEVAMPTVRRERMPRAMGDGAIDLLLIPDSTADRIMAFDPVNGDLYDPDFVPSDPENLATPIEVILSGDAQSLLVSDQVNDVVQQYALDGTYLGVFAPAGGADPSVVENLRGIDILETGHLLVTSAAGGNADSVAEFDLEGQFVGNFVEAGDGGLDDPWDITLAAGAYVSANGNDAILEFDPVTGDYVGDFAPIDSFPEQVSVAANGNLLVAVFSGNDQDVVELFPDGSVSSVIGVFEISGFRGIHELENGNLLASTGSGVYEIDRSGALIDTKITGVSGRFISRVTTPDALTVEISGVCPGEVDLSISGGTPGGEVAVLRGSGIGADEITTARCGSVVTGVENPFLRGLLALGDDGTATLTATVPPVGCGFPVQVLDGLTCELSAIANIP